MRHSLYYTSYIMKPRRIPRVLLASTWQSYELAAGVAQYATEHGWHLDMSFFVSGEYPSAWKGDGILALLGQPSGLASLILHAHAPIVSLTVNRCGLDLPYVDVDNAKVGELAAEHLLARNFKHFAYYSLTDWPVDRARGEGFASAVSAAGHACEGLTWTRHKGRLRDSWDNRQTWLQQVLWRLAKPLAVFAVDDLRAVELIEAGIALGLRIPEDLAILGVGDHKLLSNTTSLPLSSVAIDEHRIGYRAAELLDRRMRGGKKRVSGSLIAPTGVVTRKTTDTYAASHPEVAKAIHFMLDRYRTPIGIADIVAATALSQTSLYQAFRAEFEESPVRFLTRLRLDRAKALLANPALKLSVIAQDCGFGDPINLFRVFKRYEGQSPKAFREMARAAAATASIRDGSRSLSSS